MCGYVSVWFVNNNCTSIVFMLSNFGKWFFIICSFSFLLWPPGSYVIFHWCLDPLFCALFLRSLGQSSPNFATYSIVTHIYKIRSEICCTGKICGLKTLKFRQFYDLITNISRKKDITKWKVALQSAITAAYVYLFSSTSLQMAKIGPEPKPMGGHHTGHWDPF